MDVIAAIASDTEEVAQLVEQGWTLDDARAFVGEREETER